MKYIGCVFNTNNSGSLVVTQYVNSEEVHVRFINTGYETKAGLGQIRKGNVKDKLTASVYGVGVLGEYPTKINGVHVREYTIWKGILQRCYDTKFQDKYKTYRGVMISDNFKNYQYFKEWCNMQVGFDQDDWQLDKDILVRGNKLYSEDTCCFVPREINTLFTKRDSKRGDYPIGVCYDKQTNKFKAGITIQGKSSGLGYFKTPEEAFYAYKEAKEVLIKSLANKWKDNLDEKVYEALMNYQVSITD